MSRSLSPQQIARAIGVSESSIKRWCDQGLIQSMKTAGGHRRIKLSDAIEFVRSRGHNVPPELLALPPLRQSGPRAIHRALDEFVRLLSEGHEQECRELITAAYLAEHDLIPVCDDLIAVAMRTIGELWETHELDVYQERRACAICLRGLDDCQSLLPARSQTAPVAIGGSPEHDPYQLPTRMVELALRQSGWNATSLGSGLPLATLSNAAKRHRAQLVWLSVSSPVDPETFAPAFAKFKQSLPRKCRLIAGGRGLTAELRERLPLDAHPVNVRQMTELVTTPN
ncbi:MAG: B12-binding domain-containing protein [Planctomycetales bacterium]|nr:B12-binding domain-containing protein [Planctomycetales bacterium]